MYQLRPFREEDREAIVSFNNRDLPSYRQYTVADWLMQDRQRSEQEVYRRLVVGEPAQAYLEAVDAGTLWHFRDPGTCDFALIVAHEYRRSGIGSFLYQQVKTYAREWHARRLRIWFYQYHADDPGVSFLLKRGFREDACRQTSSLDLALFDPNQFSRYQSGLARHGITCISYSHMDDTRENRQKLYELMKFFGHTPEHVSFESWERESFSQIDWEREIIVVAEKQGEWLGITITTVFNQGARISRIRFTGTLPEYRSRGIAAALKVRSIELLQQRGDTLLLTSNRINNVPILAVNRRLGFMPGPLELTYVRDLSVEDNEL